MLYLIRDRQRSWITCNIVVCGLRLFYHETLQRDRTTFSIPSPRQPGTLPALLSREEVQRLIAHAPHLTHRTIISPSSTSRQRHLRIPRDDRWLARTAPGRLRTWIRSSTLCLAPADRHPPRLTAPPDTRRAPTLRASCPAIHSARPRTAVESGAAARPTRRTIPIRCAAPSQRGFVQQGLSARSARGCTPELRRRADQTLFVSRMDIQINAV